MTDEYADCWDESFCYPHSLNAAVVSFDTPGAWETADHVSFMRPDGAIAHSKGHLAIGSSEFAICPPIPGLRLNFGDKSIVTFGRQISREVLLDLHKRLVQAVMIMIAVRCGGAPKPYAYTDPDTLLSSLVYGVPLSDNKVQGLLAKDDKAIADLTVVVNRHPVLESEFEAATRRSNERVLGNIASTVMNEQRRALIAAGIIADDSVATTSDDKRRKRFPEPE
jgi:hypothetical protein